MNQTNLNYWQIAFIFSSAFGMFSFAVGEQLSNTMPLGSALSSILIGHLLAWIIGLVIVEMTYTEKSNAIENVRQYLGRTGGLITAFIVVLAFLLWFSIQIRLSVSAIGVLVTPLTKWTPNIGLRIGASLGIIIALLSIQGIKMIKWFCILSFPFIYIYLFYISFVHGSFGSIYGSWMPSLFGVIVTTSSFLPGIINLPTFFRHACSKVDAIFALSLFILLGIILQSLILISQVSMPSEILLINRLSISVFITGIFIVLTLFCVNLVNIYFASAGWEMIIPKISGAKEYVITGLVGTVIFAFIQASEWMEFIENMLSNFLANLGIVLFIDFVLRIIVQHRPRTSEKLVSMSCWIIGCIASTISQVYFKEDSTKPVMIGMSVIILSFVLIMFFEETLWATKDVIKN